MRQRSLILSIDISTEPLASDGMARQIFRSGITPLPLVNIIDEVGAEIRARGYRRVALFGTR
jgi:hypothetical protein